MALKQYQRLPDTRAEKQETTLGERSGGINGGTLWLAERKGQTKN